MLETGELRALEFFVVLVSGQCKALLGVHEGFRIEGVLGF